MPQISLRRLFVAVALAAAVIAFSRWWVWTASLAKMPVTVTGVVLAIAAAIFFRPGSRANAPFLLALVAMYAPFVWMIYVSWGPLIGMGDTAIFVPTGWAYVVASLLKGSGVHPDSFVWIAPFVILSELALTAWVASRGWKWSIPWAVLLLLVSCMLSYIAYQGYLV